jgi:large subunit ribosomal protein L30
MTWTVVRVRGTIHAKHEVAETLRFLHLSRPNHATVVPETPSVRGMLHRVQGYITWGEADAATVELLLKQRGETVDGVRLSGPVPQGRPPLPDVGELTQKVTAAGILGAPEVKPLFRLTAPKGGWKSTKKPFVRGGALGYRGAAINDLVRRMV